MTDVDAETIRREWGTVYAAGGAKTHLQPDCLYRTDRHTEADADALPGDHLDVCSRCLASFGSWRSGLERDEKNRCERCGATTTNVRYCADCQLHVERTRARRR